MHEVWLSPIGLVVVVARYAQSLALTSWFSVCGHERKHVGRSGFGVAAIGAEEPNCRVSGAVTDEVVPTLSVDIRGTSV